MAIQIVGCRPQLGIRLRHAVSPHLAAKWAGVSIDIQALPKPEGSGWIVEGAGGFLVPINDHTLMADFIRLLDLPALIVARSGLGTINHTLLTLEAARARRLAVAGVVLCRAAATAGADEPTNPDAIAAYGRVPVLGLFPHGDDADAVADRVLAQIQPRAR